MATDKNTFQIEENISFKHINCNKEISIMILE